MEIDSITLRLISSPLKTPFITHLETVTKREAIIIEARDREGRTGYGEADPFSSPWYTEETIATCWLMLRDYLIPLMRHREISGPRVLDALWSGIRRNRMAKSGLSQAIWDLYAKEKGLYLGRLVGSVRKKVAAGAVIAAGNNEEAVRQIEHYSASGYQRYKIKISRSTDVALLSLIRDRFPDIALTADANSAYSLRDLEHLKQLDAFKLQMIEQPFAYNDLVEHAALQHQIKTPVCLDESICSLDDARSALKLGSCRVVNLKMARVGGWAEALKIHGLCLKEGIPLWCGGMIEFGVAKAHNIALAALEGFTLPGDLFASSRYWPRDIIEPEIKVENGYIRVPDGKGIGFGINQKQLEALTKNCMVFKM
ncbi:MULTISPECIES: o-succinylbenzoate synthase [unclassified Sporolactobacillus]|uniref:o-succinylbenzoate synthase n=1 Tax=unclassified Sporolactobacillus TaxID=2628533 RepID=UPI0023686120|nr:o-succinylbenzoate synthase [Sporolactobacillus sp. CQH2019]MDD9148782.1 o-succinylbenzoate synthase [Sporolactobacillus sp. CQH2019]